MTRALMSNPIITWSRVRSARTTPGLGQGLEGDGSREGGEVIHSQGVDEGIVEVDEVTPERTE